VRVFQFSSLNKIIPKFIKMADLPRNIKVMYSGAERFFSNELKETLQQAGQFKPSQIRERERKAELKKKTERKRTTRTKGKRKNNQKTRKIQIQKAKQHRNNNRTMNGYTKNNKNDKQSYTTSN